MNLPTWMTRRVIIGVFALACATAAVWLAHQWIQGKERALALKEQEIMKNYQAPVQVIVAAKDLPEETLLEPTHLRMATVPERFVQPYAARAPQEVVGRVTAVPMAQDEQILANKLRRPEDVPRGSTLSSVTPKGKRAVTIAVDAITGVGGFVRPGDIVDILWTIKLPEAGQKEGQVVTLTVFQDVPVLAIGGEMVGRRPAAGGEKKEGSEYTVTLALSPQETSFLLFAREQGRIQLSLRSKADEGTPVAVVPASITTLLEMQLGIKPAGAPAVRPGRQVEVYKGLKRDIVALSDGQ